MSTRVPRPASLWIESVAADLPENRAADREAEAVAVGLGREERFHHSRQVLRRDPAAGIFNRDFHDTVGRADGHRDASAVGRRFACVGEEVEEDLLEVALAAGDCGQVVGDVGGQLDSPPPHPVLQNGGHRVESARRTCPCRVRRAAPRENDSIPPKIRRQTCSDF